MLTADIKTRETKKDIRFLDKAGDLSRHMKNTAVRAKDHAENRADNDRGSPSGYAQDKLSSAAEDASDVAGRGAKAGIRKARQAYAGRREKIRERKAEEEISRNDPGMNGSNAGNGNPVYVKGARTGTNDSGSPPIRTIGCRHTYVKTSGREENMARQPVRTAEERSVKKADAAVKAAGRAVKTRKRAAHGAVKTSEVYTVLPQRVAIAGGGTVNTQAIAVRQRSRTAQEAARVAARAVQSFIKAVRTAAQSLITKITAGGSIAVIAVILICLIGMMAGSSFGIFFAGEKSADGRTIRDAVSEINADYDKKLDAAKASAGNAKLEMSGSRADWPDVLAVYAVKTTTDADHPQEVATVTDEKEKILKDIFWEMNKISTRSESRTETVVTKSDDGHGNTVEEKKKQKKTTVYVTVSHKSASDMAKQYGFNGDQKEQLAELLASENQSMWSSVLYCSPGSFGGDGQIVTVALSQVGNVGGQPYWSWYGFGGRVEWCACFVSWCANQCGYIESGVIPKYASCTYGVGWFKSHNEWVDRSVTPEPGMIIFFDWDRDGSPEHTGIVEKAENGRVYTVEGNSRNACRQRRYPVGYSMILGYGCPNY